MTDSVSSGIFRTAKIRLERAARNLNRDLLRTVKSNMSTMHHHVFTRMVSGTSPRSIGVFSGTLLASLERPKSKVLRRTNRGAVTLQVEAGFGAGVPYAAVHEKGGRPRVIKALHAPLLKFKTKGGQWISKKQVNWPGVPPRIGFRAEFKKAIKRTRIELRTMIVSGRINA